MKLVVTTAISVTLCGAYFCADNAYAASKSTPGGTLLLPLSPKLDETNTIPTPAAAPAEVSTKKSKRESKESKAPSPDLHPIAGYLTPAAPAKQAVPPAQTTAKQPAPAKKASPAAQTTTKQPALTKETAQFSPDPAAINDVKAASSGLVLSETAEVDEGLTTFETPILDTTVDTKLKPAPQNIAAENGPSDDMSSAEIIDENTQLKGTVQIVADDTEYDQERNTFLGTGNAVAIIAGQDSKLEADSILYDQTTQMIDARGNVKILRDGQLTTGSSFKFNVNSDEYMITDPDTEVQGTTVIARSAVGKNGGLAFKKGTISMPEPFRLHKNEFFGPLSAAEETLEKDVHPEAYMPAKASYTFSARKMTYEKYKESGNLTVQGGRLNMGNFSVPLPKFQATVGNENNRVVFPVTPFIGNNINVGGVNVGPMFNTAIGKDGLFSWSPLVQVGGASITGVKDPEAAKIGAGFKLRYTTKKLSTQIAYGSVSNILVAELKYRVRPGLVFQSGINRFMQDGLFGIRRPRAIAEVVANKTFTRVPFLAMVDFRTSAGYMQDQPALLGLTPQFGQLFSNDTSKVIKSGYRVSEQIMFTTHPLVAVGDDKYGAKLALFGGAALRGYSSGDSMAMAQMGPTLNAHLNRVRLQVGYTQSGVAGKSPFVFDQFIQGTRSCFMSGDVRLSKYFTLGGNLGYNLVNKMVLGRTITAAIGPPDFKVILSRETITGTNRFGFDVLYGAPIPYDKLVLKAKPDHGQLGGI